MGRAGLKSGVNPSHNIVVSGDNAAGSRVQKEVDSCELVLRAASEMDNPGILRVLRSSPRAVPGAVSAPGQSTAGPGQSSGQARLAVEGRAPRVVYQLVLLVMLVVVLQDVEDLGSWAVRTGQGLGSHC